MIITKVRLQEEHPMASATESWPLPVCDFHLDWHSGENGYILKEVVGLDPPDFTAIVIGFDSTGKPMKGTALAIRDLVFKVALSPNMGQSYSNLRDSLYKLVDRSLLVSLMDDYYVIGQVSGFIRHFEAIHFTNLPEVLITFQCDESWFTAPAHVDIPLTDLDTVQPIINYELGTAPTGLEMKFSVSAAAPDGFTIFNHAQLWYVGPGPVDNVFDVSFPLLTGDVVTITTQTKNQRIMLLRGLVEYDISGYVNAGAVWPQLSAGVNTFEWSLDSSWMDWIYARYTPRYWGV